MFYVILDFEATCSEEKLEPQEIIEFPSVVVHNQQIVSEFRTYVRPIHNRQLSSFCTKLTGIQQDQVDAAPEFLTANKEYNKWLASVVGQHPYIFITCGNWDLQTMYPAQCKMSGIQVPPRFKRWINICDDFKKLYQVKPGGLAGMMQYLRLDWIGRHHSGLDDCKNTAQIWLRMLADKNE